jgi:hypothetical protein
MFSPIGNAVGQLIPVILVSKNLDTASASTTTSSGSNNDDDSNYNISGMPDLMLVELILCVIPVILAAFLLSDRPPTPPSNSMQRKSKASTVVQGNLTRQGTDNDLDDDIIVSQANSSGIVSLKLTEINAIIKHSYIHTVYTIPYHTIYTYLMDLL